VIEHQSLGAVNLGYHSGPAGSVETRQALVEEGAELFRSAGLESTAMADLQQARWQKLVWNVPYNGLSVLLDAGTTRLMASADSRGLILDLMQEVVQGAAACGHVLPEGYAQKLLTVTERMPDYLPSMYHDFKHKRPLELQAIYAAPLAAAAAAGCELPKMRMLHQALRFLDAS
jgi:2-dehydropantoate 2-reductase